MEISEDFRSIAQKYAIISFFEEDAYNGIGAVVGLLPISISILLGTSSW